MASDASTWGFVAYDEADWKFSVPSPQTYRLLNRGGSLVRIGSGRLRLLVLSMVGALLLTACELRIFADLVIEADESGTFTVELSMDDALASLAGAQLGDGLAVGEELVPDGWSTTAVSEDGYEGIRATASFESLAGLQEILSDLMSTGGQSTDLGLLDFLAAGLPTREGDTYRFSLAIPAGVEGLLGEGLADSPVPLDVAMLDQVLDIRISVMLPGEIVSHNADLHTGSLLVWNLSLADPGRTLEAESRLQSSGGAIVWIAVAAALVIVIVLVVMVQSRRRRAGSAEPGTEHPDGRAAVK